jgi:tripartite-type tricarboxylate transporter receptor subunit TctC
MPLLRVVCAAVALLWAAAPALAQYPNRPVKVIIGYAPGGAPDLLARFVTQRLTKLLGQPVVVENRPGSNGNIAGDLTAKAAPDGYTLVLAPDSQIVVNPHLYPKLPYDPIKDLVPVSTVATSQFFLAVNPAFPARTFQEFIDLAKKANPPLAYGSAGNGSAHHLMMELLKQVAKLDMSHVPYRSGAPAATALVAGEVPVMISGASNAVQMKGGKIRPLATTGAQRSLMFPELPTIGEFYPGYEFTVWLGVFAPAGTPEPVLARLRADIGTALNDPHVREKIASISLQPITWNIAQFKTAITRDYEKYGKLVKDIGATID